MRLGIIFLSIFLSGCDLSRVPGLWKEYEHPTYRFQLKVPRSWDIQDPSALVGVQVSFIAPKKEPNFRANANIVVQPKEEKFSLSTVAEQSQKQLKLLFQNYRLLSKGPAKLGNLSAFELRGQYQAQEGFRLVRSIFGASKDMLYVFTFSCPQAQERNYHRTVQLIISSFKAQTTLSQ